MLELRMQRSDAAALKLLIDVVMGMGGMSHDYVTQVVMREREYVLLFGERTAEGLVPLAELSPPEGNYEEVASDDEGGTG